MLKRQLLRCVCVCVCMCVCVPVIVPSPHSHRIPPKSQRILFSTGVFDWRSRMSIEKARKQYKNGFTLLKGYKRACLVPPPLTIGVM